MIRLFCNIIFFAVIPVHSCNGQQSIVLRINVIDETKTGIPEAEIIFKNADTSIVYIADLEGMLEITGLTRGTYKIEVSAIGCYKLKDYPITIDKAQEQLTIEMQTLKNLNKANVEWAGGWVTFIDKHGNIKSVRSRKE